MSFWPSWCFSIVCLRMNIASVVLRPGIDPNWLSSISVHSLDLLSTTFSHILKMCEQFDDSVILTVLKVTLFFENGDQHAVSPGRWYALSGHDYVEKFAKCHHSQLSQAFPYLHWYLVAAHSLATLHPSQCSLCLCLTDWARHALVGRPVLGLHSWILFIHEPAEILAPSLYNVFIFH